MKRFIIRKIPSSPSFVSRFPFIFQRQREEFNAIFLFLSGESRNPMGWIVLSVLFDLFDIWVEWNGFLIWWGFLGCDLFRGLWLWNFGRCRFFCRGFYCQISYFSDLITIHFQEQSTYQHLSESKHLPAVSRLDEAMTWLQR